MLASLPLRLLPSTRQGVIKVFRGQKSGDVPSPSARWVTKAVFHKHQPFEMNLAYEFDDFREFLGLLLQCLWKKPEQISTSIAIAIARHGITSVQCVFNNAQLSISLWHLFAFQYRCFRRHSVSRASMFTATGDESRRWLHVTQHFRHLQLHPIRPSLQGTFAQSFSHHLPSGETHALDIWTPVARRHATAATPHQCMHRLCSGREDLTKLTCSVGVPQFSRHRQCRTILFLSALQAMFVISDQVGLRPMTQKMTACSISTATTLQDR